MESYFSIEFIFAIVKWPTLLFFISLETAVVPLLLDNSQNALIIILHSTSLVLTTIPTRLTFHLLFNRFPSCHSFYFTDSKHLYPPKNILYGHVFTQRKLIWKKRKYNLKKYDMDIEHPWLLFINILPFCATKSWILFWPQDFLLLCCTWWYYPFQKSSNE